MAAWSRRGATRSVQRPPTQKKLLVLDRQASAAMHRIAPRCAAAIRTPCPTQTAQSKLGYSQPSRADQSNPGVPATPRTFGQRRAGAPCPKDYRDNPNFMRLARRWTNSTPFMPIRLGGGRPASRNSQSRKARSLCCPALSGRNTTWQASPETGRRFGSGRNGRPAARSSRAMTLRGKRHAPALTSRLRDGGGVVDPDAARRWHAGCAHLLKPQAPTREAARPSMERS